MDDDDDEDMVGFYLKRGINVLQLDATGDCLIDQMCVALGQQTTVASRLAIRLELAECLCAHVENVEFVRSMAALKEVTVEEAELAVTELQHGGGHMQRALAAVDSAVAELPLDAIPDVSEEAIRAVRWACNLFSVNSCGRPDRPEIAHLGACREYPKVGAGRPTRRGGAQTRRADNRAEITTRS